MGIINECVAFGFSKDHSMLVVVVSELDSCSVIIM